ncbi:MAG: hypothetical protein KDK99_22095 [Verrucomicrobiales bacterium]|nr:hypothetical protein [Verrucomicrobiales bacterium]
MAQVNNPIEPGEAVAPASVGDSFGVAAGRVVRRVLLRRGLTGWGRGAGWVGLGMGVMLVVVLLLWPGWAVAMGGVLLLGWVVFAVGWVWWQRPDAYSAWAHWDEVAGRREDFAAAWWIESERATEAAAVRHWEMQRVRLPEAMKKLAEDLPLPVPWRALAVTAGLLVALGGLQWGMRPEVEPALSESGVAAAGTVAEQVAQMAEQTPEAGLTAEERGELEKQLKQAAEALQQAAGESLREVLAQVESRAQAMEEIALRQGLDGERWASEALTQVLQEQADTGDLGDAVAAHQAEAAAEQAERLAGLLEKGTESAAGERVAQGLQKAGAAAEEADARRLVGGPVTEAAAAVAEGRASEAEAAMRRLAEGLREVARRERAREQVQRLADQLRAAGGQVAAAEGGLEQVDSVAEVADSESASGGENNSEPASSAADEGAAQKGAANQAAWSPPPNAAPPNPSGAEGSASAGQQGGQGQTGEMRAAAGQSGRANQPPDTDAGDDLPQIFAPIPGQPGDQPPDTLISGGPPPAGAELQRMQMAGSGLRAGAGTAEMKGDATFAQQASREALVQAQDTGEGQSAKRQVAGGAPQTEQAQRARQQQAREFSAADEAALDELALPPARREAVRRYFNELRRRFENAP